MCRFILGIGSELPVRALAQAACDMARGKAGRAPKPELHHLDGWGGICVHADPERAFTFVRSAMPIEMDDVLGALERTEPRVLALHVRQATRRENLGIAFTHPVIRGATAILHNGYAPNIALQAFGRPSRFDTQELLDYVAGPENTHLTEEGIRRKLDVIDDGYTSVNSFILDKNSCAIINWYNDGVFSVDYYTIWRCRVGKYEIFSSEIIPYISDPANWSPMRNREIITYSIKKAGQYV